MLVSDMLVSDMLDMDMDTLPTDIPPLDTTVRDLLRLSQRPRLMRLYYGGYGYGLGYAGLG